MNIKDKELIKVTKFSTSERMLTVVKRFKNVQHNGIENLLILLFDIVKI